MPPGTTEACIDFTDVVRFSPSCAMCSSDPGNLWITDMTADNSVSFAPATLLANDLIWEDLTFA